MIELFQVSKAYPAAAVPAVDEISIRVDEGELLVLLGESGSGKTTTLKMVNRLIEPTSGRIVVNGEDVLAQDPILLRRGIGYVFQGIGLFPHMTIAANVGAVPSILGWDAGKIQSRVTECLELVNLPPDEFADRLPRELSGGQMQRVGVARALAAEPKILLMDEPFGALDPITRSTLQDDFMTLRNKLGVTVMLVTHDIAEALLLGDRIGVMKDGKLLQIGTPEDLVCRPEHSYVEGLVRTAKRHAHHLEVIGNADGS